MLFPLFSVLRLEPSFARPPSQMLLLHLKKTHLMEWVRSVLAVTLGVPPNQDLPPMMLHQEVDSVWKQIREWAALRRMGRVGLAGHKSVLKQAGNSGLL
jgi:hypothetical protein